jgi:hypothetical protein
VGYLWLGSEDSPDLAVDIVNLSLSLSLSSNFFSFLFLLWMDFFWTSMRVCRAPLQKTVVLITVHVTFFFFFTFLYFLILINVKTFLFLFIFYITSIIFYYYLNKKIHYNTKLFHFSIQILFTLYRIITLY